jgi:thioredoxin-related protein
MKKVFGFLFFWMLAISLAGCTSKNEEKKNAEEVQVSAVVPEDFERAVPPAMMTSPQERADYFVTHFWDKFNFSDTMYCHAPDITEQAFVDFIALFPHTSSSQVISDGVGKLLAAAEVEIVMYNYFYARAEHYLYNPNSPMRNDEYYIPFLEHIVNSSKVTDVHKIRPRHLLKLACRNRTGSAAEDFTYTTAAGKTGRLYGLSAKYLLLMFYNPDCVECQHTMEMLKNSTAVAAAVESGHMKVLAVYPDENLEAWHKHLKDVPPAWINAYDKSLTVKNNEIYDLKAIPTLYLLDKDKKVILKDTSTADIHEYLERSR